MLGVLVLAALLSAYRGAQNGYHNSQDFQWTGANLLAEHIDPWKDALDGDPLHRLILTQNPNYLPMLYVLIAPLGWMRQVPAQLIWVVFNILFAIASAWLAARFYGMRRYGVALTICLLLASTPVRMTIGNGQQGLLVLLFWSLGLLTLRLTAGRSALAGGSYFKYNFAPPVVMYLWLRDGLRAVLWSAVPAAVGTLLVWLWLTGGHGVAKIAWLVVAPLKLSRIGYFPAGGGSNLMDVLEVPMYMAGMQRTLIDGITLLVALAVCFAVLRRAMRGASRDAVHCHLALLGVLSFSLFKHHTYDSVVLLFPLCYLLRMRHDAKARVGLGLLAFVWYAERAVDQLLPRLRDWMFIPLFAMLMGIAWVLMALRKVDAPVFARSTVPE